MENSSPENCQVCFRPFAAGASQTQWISVCRCQLQYAPKSDFSIDICAICKQRIPVVRAIAKCQGICSCDAPQPKKVPAVLKPKEKDSLELDLTAAGLSPDTFPAERYAPLAILGNSARATTILARDRPSGRKVAVKCFKRIAPALRSTFEGEVRKNQQLNHQSIPKILDFGFHNNKAPYVVSEYKEGFSLDQCIAMHGTPSHDVAVKILMSACETLLYAQKQSVMHRDVRPGNIIFVDDMNSEPAVLVTDFALPKVKMSEELSEQWDATYMSADEGRNMDYTEKSEVYTLGGVGFFLLTGRPTFQEGSFRDIKNAHALQLPPRISSLKFDSTRPGDLEEVIERCLEKDPNYRFESVAKLLERLEVFPRRVQMKIAAALAARTRKKLLKIAAIVLAVVAVCALGGIAVMSLSHR